MHVSEPYQIYFHIAVRPEYEYLRIPESTYFFLCLHVNECPLADKSEKWLKNNYSTVKKEMFAPHF